MNAAKSTPLSHLPSTALPPTQEILPGDDDTTIQAVLNEIAGASSGPAPQQMQMQPQQAPPQQPVTSQQAAFMAAQQQQATAAALSSVDTNTLLAMLGSNPASAHATMMPSPTQAMMSAQVPAATAQNSNNMMTLLMKVLTQDFKLATVVFVIYIAVSFVPVSNILGKYFDLSRVPYAELIIKAVVAAIGVTLLVKSFVR